MGCNNEEIIEKKITNLDHDYIKNSHKIPKKAENNVSKNKNKTGTNEKFNERMQIDNSENNYNSYNNNNNSEDYMYQSKIESLLSRKTNRQNE